MRTHEVPSLNFLWRLKFYFLGVFIFLTFVTYAFFPSKFCLQKSCCEMYSDYQNAHVVFNRLCTGCYSKAYLLFSCVTQPLLPAICLPPPLPCPALLPPPSSKLLPGGLFPVRLTKKYTFKNICGLGKSTA
jgi:hypothetical protein